jgi:alpha-glucosidase (family GH31 glycosyl hydrolase)
MMMNLFGIPVSGADICGFGGDTTAELCARWTVVGSFSPFSRNHNAYGAMVQEPYQFPGMYEGEISFTSIMTQAIRNRYHLVRYYYTQLYLVNQMGGAFYKPVFHEFPADP